MIKVRRTYIFFLVGLMSACSRQDAISMHAKDIATVPMESKRIAVRSMKDVHARYSSSEQDWLKFLLCWKEGLIQNAHNNREHDRVFSILQENEKFIAKPDSEAYKNRLATLKKVEQRLNILRFPNSYRHFVAISGGEWIAGFNLDASVAGSNLTSIDKVGYFKDVDRLNWEGWHNAAGNADVESLLVPADEYFRYDNSQDRFRWSYLDKLIKVGELERGTVLLINPLEITADGEWEAWLLSPQVGAKRYRSFAELMQIVAYQEIRQTGGYNVSSENLSLACGAHLKTAATLPAEK